MKKATIISTGICIPEIKISNSFFDEKYQKNISSFLETQRNIKTRHWMRPEQSTSDLATIAAQHALERANLSADVIDLIVVATDTPDQLSPSTASVVAHNLKAINAGIFDLNAACAGFVTACDLGFKYIQADARYKNILIIGAYAMSKWINDEDYKSKSVFADGAGAVIIQPTESPFGFLNSYLKSEPQYHDSMGIYAGGSKKPFSEDTLKNKDHFLSFPRRIPPEINPTEWPKMISKILSECHKKPSDVDLFFMTQLNILNIQKCLSRLNVPIEKSHNVMDKFGYTGSASIAMSLADADHSGKLKKGDLIVMIGSGGGLSMAGLALEWGYNS